MTPRLVNSIDPSKASAERSAAKVMVLSLDLEEECMPEQDAGRLTDREDHVQCAAYSE